jgi:signal transduction histidine kinase
MQLLASEKRLALSCSSDGPVPTIGDETRIKQVLVNLLDNAIKYTSTEGHVEVSAEAQNGNAVLTVSDNGIGIPEESLPHVFERFYRAEKARSRGSAGFGLGLSLVQAVCRAHGGAVSIESTEGRGTTVRVSLPLRDKAHFQ